MTEQDYGPNFVVITPAELAELKAKTEEYLGTAKRVQADFINFQERVRAEKADAGVYAVERLLKDLVPALESFDTCLKHVTDPVMADGIKIIQKEIWRVLGKWGVKPIETLGKPFDPRLHQAAGILETAEHPDGTIVEELKAGFTLQDRVLRPALVRVARKPVPLDTAPPAP